MSQPKIDAAAAAAEAIGVEVGVEAVERKPAADAVILDYPGLEPIKRQLLAAAEYAGEDATVLRELLDPREHQSNAEALAELVSLGFEITPAMGGLGWYRAVSKLFDLLEQELTPAGMRRLVLAFQSLIEPGSGYVDGTDEIAIMLLPDLEQALARLRELTGQTMPDADSIRAVRQAEMLLGVKMAKRIEQSAFTVTEVDGPGTMADDSAAPAAPAAAAAAPAADAADAEVPDPIVTIDVARLRAGLADLRRYYSRVTDPTEAHVSSHLEAGLHGSFTIVERSLRFREDAEAAGEPLAKRNLSILRAFQSIVRECISAGRRTVPPAAPAPFSPAAPAPSAIDPQTLTLMFCRLRDVYRFSYDGSQSRGIVPFTIAVRQFRTACCKTASGVYIAGVDNTSRRLEEILPFRPDRLTVEALLEKIRRQLLPIPLCAIALTADQRDAPAVGTVSRHWMAALRDLKRPTLDRASSDPRYPVMTMHLSSPVPPPADVSARAIRETFESEPAGKKLRASYELDTGRLAVLRGMVAAATSTPLTAAKVATLEFLEETLSGENARRLEWTPSQTAPLDRASLRRRLAEFRSALHAGDHIEIQDLCSELDRDQTLVGFAADVPAEWSAWLRNESDAIFSACFLEEENYYDYRRYARHVVTLEPPTDPANTSISVRRVSETDAAAATDAVAATATDAAAAEAEVETTAAGGDPKMATEDEAAQTADDEAGLENRLAALALRFRFGLMPPSSGLTPPPNSAYRGFVASAGMLRHAIRRASVLPVPAGVKPPTVAVQPRILDADQLAAAFLEYVGDDLHRVCENDLRQGRFATGLVKLQAFLRSGTLVTDSSLRFRRFLDRVRQMETALGQDDLFGARRSMCQAARHFDAMRYSDPVPVMTRQELFEEYDTLIRMAEGCIERDLERHEKRSRTEQAFRQAVGFGRKLERTMALGPDLYRRRFDALVDDLYRMERETPCVTARTVYEKIKALNANVGRQITKTELAELYPMITSRAVTQHVVEAMIKRCTEGIAGYEDSKSLRFRRFVDRVEHSEYRIDNYPCWAESGNLAWAVRSYFVPMKGPAVRVDDLLERFDRLVQLTNPLPDAPRPKMAQVYAYIVELHDYAESLETIDGYRIDDRITPKIIERFIEELGLLRDSWPEKDYDLPTLIVLRVDSMATLLQRGAAPHPVIADRPGTNPELTDDDLKTLFSTVKRNQLRCRQEDEQHQQDIEKLNEAIATRFHRKRSYTARYAQFARRLQRIRGNGTRWHTGYHLEQMERLFREEDDDEAQIKSEAGYSMLVYSETLRQLTKADDLSQTEKYVRRLRGLADRSVWSSPIRTGFHFNAPERFDKVIDELDCLAYALTAKLSHQTIMRQVEYLAGTFYM